MAGGTAAEQFSEAWTIVSVKEEKEKTRESRAEQNSIK